MNAIHFLLLAPLPIFAVAGCNGRTTETPDGLNVAGASEYDIKGKVTAIGTDMRSVTLDHEDIPGLMKAMEMEFQIEDANVLAGIAVGDEIDSRLRVQKGNYTIMRLKAR